LATLGTRHRTITNKTGQSIDTGNTGHKTQSDHKTGQSINIGNTGYKTQNDQKKDKTHKTEN
jgi:hypothetical protein